MRFQPTGMKVRESQNEGEESRVIEGCAIVFNKETTLWDDQWDVMREVILPSCVTPEFLREQDIKLNLLHDRKSTVARNNKGEGTLVLDLREDGLYFSAEMPKCDLGNQALELVKNGTYTGCSFEFWAQDYNREVTKMADGRDNTLITHTKFERISALTIAMDPAYEQTTVNAREFEDLSKNEKRLKEQEDAEREARHQLALREQRERELWLLSHS